MNHTPDQRPRRIALGIVLPAAVLIVALLPFWLFHGRLPAPLATSWNPSGQATGAMPQALLALFVAAPTAVLAFIMFALAFRPRASRGEISGPMAGVGFASGTFASLSWLITLSNLDVATWKDASPLGFGALLLAIVPGFALGAATARFSRALETTPIANAGNLPSAGLAPGTRAVWVGSARASGASWTTPLGIAFLAMALVTQIWKPVLGPVHLILGLSILLLTSIRVTADRNGVRIAYGLLGWPVQRVLLAQIQQASVLQVKPMEWGGWGYRGSLKLMRRAAVVMRAGEGIRLQLDGERTLVITVDDAEQGAGVINDLIASHRAQLAANAGHVAQRSAVVRMSEPARLPASV